MYSILIIEDSDDEAQVLSSHLDRYATERGITFNVERRTNAFDFVDLKGHFDLVFMDIDLPGISGVEAAQMLRINDDKTALIFVTNLAQYAIKGYEVNALDFIVKPVSYYSFSLRMDRALRIISRETERTHVIHTRNGMQVTSIRDISFVDVTNHELAYHLADGAEPITARETLSDFETEVSGLSFVRISKSFLVNMANIIRIEGDCLTMAPDEKVFFSRPRKKAALQTINQYLGGSL